MNRRVNIAGAVAIVVAAAALPLAIKAVAGVSPEASSSPVDIIYWSGPVGEPVDPPNE